MLALMANSATYRQSSQASPALLAHDPGNGLLVRGPARRLTAEMLRDQALAVSGLLVDTKGGPPVKPYQPDGLWAVAMGSPTYDQSHGADLHRRSLYTYWKRTVPHPAMVTFDAAERNVCSARRQSTSTPLQALALLNDVQIVEAARLLSERMQKEGGPSDKSKVAWVFCQVAGRVATTRNRRPRAPLDRAKGVLPIRARGGEASPYRGGDAERPRSRPGRAGRRDRCGRSSIKPR